jgi:hypothetical protein
MGSSASSSDLDGHNIMTIREAIQKKPSVSLIASIVVIAGTIFFIARNTLSGPQTASSRAYYTTDEGRTTFVDTLNRIPPFDHDGKSASRIWMFTCDGGQTLIPGYMERYTPTAKARLEAALAKDTSDNSHSVSLGVGPADTEVKKPGEGNQWVARTNLAEASKVTAVSCPSGGELEIVMP